jgi:DNA (cytosine-5)-methyltransferase 1
MTWKTKVSKANVLLFQLQASVHGIKGKGSGFLPTPTTMDHIDRKGMRPSRAATNRKTGYLSEMIMMFPTPTQDSASERTKKYKQGGMPLTVAVQMLPTPTHSEHKYRLKGNTQASKCLEAQARRLGGKLNPNFVEFLMGYPMNWTKIDPTE